MTLHRLLKVCVIFALVAVAILSTGVLVRAAPPRASSPDSVIHWNDIAQRVVIQVAKQSPAATAVYMALPQAAVYDAVVAIEGGYQPYKLNLKPRPGASVDAAVAAAAYNILVHYFPDQKDALDADYNTALAAIPDNTAKTDGVAVGQEAAAGIIADRQGDGLAADIGFKMPDAGPGVWQLPEGAKPVAPWLSKLKPFMLNSPDQFRPGPPPALNSAEWAKEFNEIKEIGGSDSKVRTPEQTDIAQFWTANATGQYDTAYAKLILDRGLDAVQAARLYAMTNLVGADAIIGCFDAKYHYLFWRPFTSMVQATAAENPNTVGDPNWKPLVVTPGHPEYPAAHGCYTMAQAQTLATALGTDQINLDVSSSVPNLKQPTRHYATASDLISEVENARVWGGIHYRDSTTAGATLGNNVAKWTLARNFSPTSSAATPATLPTTGENFGSSPYVWLGLAFGLVVLLVGARLLIVKARNPRH